MEDTIENTELPPSTDGLMGEILAEESIEKQIKQSYIDYAMTVIVSRALPDTRDGLKPVIRRILFSMYDMKNFFSSRHKKSARIVGDVLGKYHPHGDSSVYDAMVRLAQPWSLRYPLIDGQGNFGSIDGDGAAAMRYTEARMSKIAEEMLADIELDTVNRRPNFDGSLDEPVMLPTKFPNHLCNGTMGIAVGMATNMPPHNLCEVIDASLLLLEKEGKVDENGLAHEVTIDEIMTIIKGPDFPTGGYIYDSANILEVYKKGKGGIAMRGKTHIEDDPKHGKIIVIDEVPYQTNKATLVSKIADLVVDKRIEGIEDIRDESSKDKIRVAIYLKKGVNADKILVLLFKMSDLQCNFNINNVTLVEEGRQPRLLDIKELLREFVVFRRQVVYRRSVYLLQKAQSRLHLLEGLRKAIDIIDEVIATIRKADTKQEAKDNLITKFEFSQEQAEYILMMRLQSLVGLELQKISDEIEEKKKEIAYLESIIGDATILDGVVADEMNYMKDVYGDKRKTILVDDSNSHELNSSLKDLIRQADMIKEDCIAWIGNDYSVRVLYQSRILNIPENTIDLIYTNNQDKLIVITDIGELVVERLKDIGSMKISDTPLDLRKHFNLKGKIIFAKTLHVHYDYLCIVTSDNNIKKIDKTLVLSFKKFPTIIMNLPAKNEKILSVLPVIAGDVLGIITQQGRMLLFKESDMRPMGKNAGGVKAIELQEKDTVTGAFVQRVDPFIFVHGKQEGKLVNMEDLRVWKRARKGDKVVSKLKDVVCGAMSIDEGAVTLCFVDSTLETIHSNDIHLDMPETPMEKISNKDIKTVFRPWEEKSEKPQKTQDGEGDDKSSNESLFDSDKD